MATTIFFMLIGLAVAFLLYVLANLWGEGRASRNVARQWRADLGRDGRPEVFVVTHPISTSAQGGLSVIPFRALESVIPPQHARRPGGRGILAIPPKRASTR